MNMEIDLLNGIICGNTKMDLDDLDKQINLGHLLLTDRKCRTCGQTKNLIGEFYRTRKDRGPVASSYSYECKECTIKRIINCRKKQNIPYLETEYPDW
jgi:hypothetical protein